MGITSLKYPFLFSDFVKTIKSDKLWKILNQNKIVHNIELLIALITRCCGSITLHARIFATRKRKSKVFFRNCSQKLVTAIDVNNEVR